MDAKLFKHNASLSLVSHKGVINYMVGNIIINVNIVKPSSLNIEHITLKELLTIANYIKLYYGLRLSVNRIASIIIEGSM